MDSTGNNDTSGIHVCQSFASPDPDGLEDEAHRIHAEHLRQLGQLTAGVSHDLRNIFSVVSLRLNRLERTRAAETEEMLAGMSQLRRDVELGIHLLDRLRDFVSISSMGEWQDVKLRELAHEACELSRMRLSSRSRVQISEAHEAASEVRVQVAEVLSATLNLLINAVDVTPSGGAILVRTGAAQGGGFIQVSDAGPGLPRHVQDHLFQPFFTTKPDGSGLGLFQVARCMQNHDGTVSVETDPKRGTTFRLWFPAFVRQPVQNDSTLRFGMQR